MIFISVDAYKYAEHICVLLQITIRKFYPLHPLFTVFDPQKILGGWFLWDYFFVNWGPT